MDRYENPGLEQVSEGVLEEMRLCSEGDHERGYWLSSLKEYGKRYGLDVALIGSAIANAFTTQILLRNGDREANSLARGFYSVFGGNEVGPVAFGALGIAAIYGAVEGLNHYLDKKGLIPNIRKFGVKEAVMGGATGGYLTMSVLHTITLLNSGNNKTINFIYGLWGELGRSFGN
ncbi:hypothetical protein HYV88_04335 [Candidatus Woesearchaeota archaeon]|nr:hypothetical protein [Candidatus Woesearchaeota archaeon]